MNYKVVAEALTPGGQVVLRSVSRVKVGRGSAWGVWVNIDPSTEKME